MSGLNYGSKYHLSNAERPLNGFGRDKKPVFIFDENEKLIKQYESIIECIENENINTSTLKKHIRNKKMLNNKFYSHENYLNPNTNVF